MPDNTDPPQPPDLTNTPLDPDARQYIADLWRQVEDALQSAKLEDVAAIYDSSTLGGQNVAAINRGLEKLKRQHEDCRPGADGIKHAGTGPCCVGTMWEPRELSDIMGLQMQRSEDLGVKAQRLECQNREQEAALEKHRDEVLQRRMDPVRFRDARAKAEAYERVFGPYETLISGLMETVRAQGEVIEALRVVMSGGRAAPVDPSREN